MRSRNCSPAGDPQGLRGCVMIADDGTTFEVAKPNLLAPPVHTVINVETQGGEYKWYKYGFTRVARLPNAGPDVVRQVWCKDPLIKTLNDIKIERAITGIALNKDKFPKSDPNLSDW